MGAAERRTQVGIVGAGPAGLMLGQLLHRQGIETVMLEARSREYVERRIRAGVLEQGTVDLMHELGLDTRLRREAMVDNALDIRFRDGLIHLDLPALTRTADILVAATGKRGLITGDHVNPGAVVIDVGITRDPDTGKLTGDIDRASVEPVAGALTPVPGGVGPMTVAMLLVNTYRAYRQHLGQL